MQLLNQPYNNCNNKMQLDLKHQTEIQFRVPNWEKDYDGNKMPLIPARRQ